MHALGPTIAHFLLHGAAGEGQPTLVEERTGHIRSRDPDHYGRRVSHVSETLFAFVQDGFGALLPLGNILNAQQDLLEPAKLTGADDQNPVPDHRENAAPSRNPALPYDRAGHSTAGREGAEYPSSRRKPSREVGLRPRRAVCETRRSKDGLAAVIRRSGSSIRRGAAAVSMTDMAKSRASVRAAFFDWSSWFKAVSFSLVD